MAHQEETKTKKSRKGCWIVSVVFLLLATACGYVINTIFDYPIVALRYGEAEAKYRAAKLPWTTDDIKPNPAVQPSDNAAPLIKALSDYLVAEKDNLKIDELLKNDSEGKNIEVSKWLRLNNDVVNQAIAASRPDHVDFERDWRDPINVLFPEFAQIKTACRMLQVAAVSEAKAGRDDLALERLRAIRKLAFLTQQEPSLIASLVGIACDTIALRGYERVATEWAASAPRLRNLRESLVQSNFELNWKKTLRSEAYVGTQLTRNLGRGYEMRMVDFDTVDENTPPPDVEKFKVDGPPPSFIPKAYFVRHSEFWTAIADQLSKPDVQPLEFSALSEKFVADLEAEKRMSYKLQQIILPVFSQYAEAIENRVSTINCTQGLIDALIYQRYHGFFPADASTLGMGVDTLSGQPYVLKSSEDKLIIYSFGRNKVDDGGNRKKAADVVAQYPAPAE
ncbi:hypothetical protein QPK87_39060 [Kamptonema cortianum]|nr:hypothetical protein [Geitlerinema splendidum]MDK3162503.1 hypothetical protein [Kamptonema cortianum]